MKEKSKRNSSLELLRIICVILIICHHYVVHGGFDLTSTGNDLIVQTTFLKAFSIFGKTACTIFALITGFFMIEKKTDKHYRKIIPLITELAFYSIISLIIALLTKEISVSKIDILKSILSLFWGNWFIVYYILLYFFMPFLNPWLQNLKKNEYKKLVIVSLIIWCIVPTLTANAWSFGNLAFFIVTYILGGYIKRFIFKNTTYKNNKNLFVGIISALLMIASVVILNVFGKIFHVNTLVTYSTYFGQYCNILSLICAVSIFLFFANLKFYNKYINFIAKSSLGIYLIHDNKFIKIILWQKFSPNITFLSFPYIHAPIKVLMTFIICLLIDIIRRATTGYWFTKYMQKNDNKIDMFSQKSQKILDKITLTKQPKGE